MSNPLLDKLSQDPLRKSLIQHEFFTLIKTKDVTPEDAGLFVGQWWHPLHYFPDFLSRTIAIVPILEVKTAISKILYQELGENNPAKAHERLYIETMQNAGFSRPTITDTPPSRATERLVAGYRDASEAPLSALGFVYGTEVADLVMVSGIGQAVRRATGAVNLPWVDIHITQEPDHVDEANRAMGSLLSEEDEANVHRSAKEMWTLWIDFFSTLRDQFVSNRRAVGIA